MYSESNNSYKWLIAGGALFSLMAFFLAFFSINILGIPIGVSLATLATLGGQAILYLMPIGMIVMFIFAVIPANDAQSEKTYVTVQFSAWLAAMLILAIAVISMFSRFSQGNQFLNDLGGLAGDAMLGLGDIAEVLDMFTLTPGIGLFLFVIGNIAIIVGLIMGWNEVGSEEDYLDDIRVVGEGPTEVVKRKKKSKKKAPAWLTDQDNHSHKLNRGRTTIGRIDENDIVISDSTVSQRHAIIHESNGHFRLTDLDSTNGTWLNGQLMRKPTMLHSNDEVRFGKSHSFRFLAHGR
jgi:hypothetical protein